MLLEYSKSFAFLKIDCFPTPSTFNLHNLTIFSKVVLDRMSLPVKKKKIIRIWVKIENFKNLSVILLKKGQETRFCKTLSMF